MLKIMHLIDLEHILHRIWHSTCGVNVQYYSSLDAGFTAHGGCCLDDCADGIVSIHTKESLVHPSNPDYVPRNRRGFALPLSFVPLFQIQKPYVPLRQRGSGAKFLFSHTWSAPRDGLLRADLGPNFPQSRFHRGPIASNNMRSKSHIMLGRAADHCSLGQAIHWHCAPTAYRKFRRVRKYLEIR